MIILYLTYLLVGLVLASIELTTHADLTQDDIAVHGVFYTLKLDFMTFIAFMLIWPLDVFYKEYRA